MLKKLKNGEKVNTVEPRNNGSQGTSCFFPVVPNSGVANLTILDHELAKNYHSFDAGRQNTS